MDYEGASVAEIAILHPSAVPVFNKYHIDFCCGGKLEFKKACEKVGVNPDEVIHELIHSEANYLPGTIRFDTWDTSLLSDFIVQHHHTYVKKMIPVILELLERVCDAHGETRSELFTLKATFETLGNELMDHMGKEEQILFTGIKQLANVSNTKYSDHSIFSSLLVPITMMEDEHTQAGDLIKSIRMLTGNYTPPTEACPTYKVTYKRLEEFDQDLMQHIHLENNVLFVKVRDHLMLSVL